MRTILLDLPALLSRYWWAGTDTDGTELEDGTWLNTASYALAQLIEYTLTPLLKDSAPIHWIGVLDEGIAHRQALYPEYKKARRGAREKENPRVTQTRLEMWEQAKETLPRLGMSCVSAEDVEADDVMAWLATRLRGRVDILTHDSDLIQLASKRVRVLIRGESCLTLKGCPARWVPLYKALVGDRTDEIPGLTGFGEKSFQTLWEQVGDRGLLQIERALDHPRRQQIFKGWREKSPNRFTHALFEQADAVSIQLELVRLHPEWVGEIRQNHKGKIFWYRDLPLDIKDVLHQFDRPELYYKWRSFEVRRHLVTQDNQSEQLARLRSQIEQPPLVAFDYESYDPEPVESFKKASKEEDFVDVLGQRITGVSFAVGPNLNEIYYLAVRHRDTPPVAQETVLEIIQAVEAKRPLSAHNAFFEGTLTRTHFNYRLRDLWDTQPLAHHIDENRPTDLKTLSKRYLNYRQLTFKETLEAGGAKNMSELTGQDVLVYGADDSLCTAHLFIHLRRLAQLESTWEFIRDYEFPAVHPLIESYLTGVSVGTDRLKQLQQEDKATFDKAMTQVRAALETQVTVEDEAAATTLFKELGDFEKKRCLAAGMDKEKIEQRLKNLWERCWYGTKYRPPRPVKKSVQFKFTPGQVDKVRALLGLEPKIDKISFNFLNHWIIKKRRDSSLFCHYLWAFLSDRVGFRQRKGENFDQFFNYCQQVLEEHAPTEMVGDELNLDSPIQMQLLLYGKLRLPIRLRSQVQPGSTREKLDFPGAPAVDVKALEMAAAEDAPEGDWRRPVLMALMEAKACQTRDKFFYTPLPLWVSPRDGRVHAQFKSIGTVTRRPSGSHPNFLQLPKKDGGRVRSAIQADGPDTVVVSLDFEGQELRLLGSESQDPVLTDAFIGPMRKSPHTLTACTIAIDFIHRSDEFKETDFVLTRDGLDYDFYAQTLKSGDKTLKQFLNLIRYVSKITNFLIVYGGGAPGLARQLLMPQTFAERFIDGFFQTYPRVKPWQGETTEFARTHGYTQTAYGNRRHVWPMIVDPNQSRRSRMERQATNAIIQSTAADILKIVLKEADDQHVFDDTGARLIAPVYDEIAAVVPIATLIPYVRRMTHIMELTPPGHPIPMLAEVSLGRYNWGDQIELGAHPSDEALLEAAGQLPACLPYRQARHLKIA